MDKVTGETIFSASALFPILNPPARHFLNTPFFRKRARGLLFCSRSYFCRTALRLVHHGSIIFHLHLITSKVPLRKEAAGVLLRRQQYSSAFWHPSTLQHSPRYLTYKEDSLRLTMKGQIGSWASASAEFPHAEIWYILPKFGRQWRFCLLLLVVYFCSSVCSTALLLLAEERKDEDQTFPRPNVLEICIKYLSRWLLPCAASCSMYSSDDVQAVIRSSCGLLATVLTASAFNYLDVTKLGHEQDKPDEERKKISWVG